MAEPDSPGFPAPKYSRIESPGYSSGGRSPVGRGKSKGSMGMNSSEISLIGRSQIEEGNSPSHYSRAKSPHSPRRGRPGGEKLSPEKWFRKAGEEGRTESPVGRLQKDLPVGQIRDNYIQIAELHGDLAGLVNHLEDKLEGVLEHHEKEFLMAYKKNMMDIQLELKEYKKKTDDVAVSFERDSQISKLKEQVNFLREESTTLANICNQQKTQMDRSKKKLELLQKESNFLEKQLKSSKKQNKILKIALAKSQNQCDEIISLTDPTNANSMPNQNLILQEEEVEKEVNAEFKYSTKPKTPSVNKRERQLNYNSKINQFLNTLEDLRLGKREMMEEIGSYFGYYSQKMEQIIIGLKSQLRTQKNKSSRMKSRETDHQVQRTEMEEFFYECIEEVKREIITRKQTLSYLTPYKYRTMQKQMLNFSTSDKRKVLELLLSNDQLISSLYQIIFRKGNHQQISVLERKQIGEDFEGYAPPIYPKSTGYAGVKGGISGSYGGQGSLLGGVSGNASPLSLGHSKQSSQKSVSQDPFRSKNEASSPKQYPGSFDPARRGTRKLPYAPRKFMVKDGKLMFKQIGTATNQKWKDVNQSFPVGMNKAF